MIRKPHATSAPVGDLRGGIVRAGRRRFLTLAAAGTAAAAVRPAAAQTRRQVRMVTAWPAAFPGFADSAGRLARRITVLTGGALTVQVLPAGELMGAFDVFDAVGAGEVEMYHALDSYWQGRSSAFAFFAGVPFGLTAEEHAAWIHHGGGQALWDEVAAPFSIKPLLAGNTGAHQTGWYNRPIRDPGELKGLRVAVAGLGGQILRRLGASAMALPGRELAPALAAGRIDGAEWLGPWNALAIGLPSAARYVTYPGVFAPNTAITLGLNLDFWAGLPVGQQQAIITAATAESAMSLAEFTAGNARALVALRADHGVTLTPRPDPLLKVLGEAAGTIVGELARSDPQAQSVYDAFLAFRQAALGWSRQSVQSFLNARLLPFPYGGGP